MKPEIFFAGKDGAEIIKRVNGKFAFIWKGKTVKADFLSFVFAYRYYLNEFFSVDV